MAELDGVPEVQVPGSFESLYRMNYPAVVALVYGLCGSQAAAEDVAQEAFLRAHQDWRRVSEMDSPEGWVRRVALNLARSQWRRLRTEAKATLRLGIADSSSDAPADALGEAFWAQVRRLPSRQAQAMALHYVEDRSVGEIAKVLGVAEGTVKALLHQGRERLRRQLSAKGLVDDET